MKIGGLVETKEEVVVQNNKEQIQQEQQEQQEDNLKKLPKYIHPAGGVYGDLVIEPIGYGRYIYNFCRHRGITSVEYVTKNKGNKDSKGNRAKEQNVYFVKINDYPVHFVNNKPLPQRLAFATPKLESVQRWIINEHVKPSAKELFERVRNALTLLYDLENKNAYTTHALGIFSSWVAELLNSVWYQGFDAKPGSGKTSYLEGFALLCRHGYLVGDPSVAMVARICDQQKLSIFIDEIDEHPELISLLRQGYRKGSPYTRLNTKTFVNEQFDVYGFKGYSFQSNTEKALKSRTIIDTLRPSSDDTLPILNTFKEPILRPLYEDLLFWYMDNASDLVALVVPVVLVPVVPEGGVEQQREHIYNEILDQLGFTIAETEAMRRLVGRNLELIFTALLVSKVLDIPIQEELRITFEEKQASENVFKENYYLELLQEKLQELYIDRSEALSYMSKASKGKYEGCYYVPRKFVYETFNAELQKKFLPTIATTKFFEYLKEFDFIDGDNISRQRVGNNIVDCLMFDKKSVAKINSNVVKQEPEPKVCEEEIQK